MLEKLMVVQSQLRSAVVCPRLRSKTLERVSSSSSAAADSGSVENDHSRQPLRGVGVKGCRRGQVQVFYLGNEPEEP